MDGDTRLERRLSRPRCNQSDLSAPPQPLQSHMERILTNGAQALHEVDTFGRTREGDGPPAHLLRRERLTGEVGLDIREVDLLELLVHHRRQNAVQPRALVLVARQRECRARQLLGVESVGALLSLTASSVAVP